MDDDEIYAKQGLIKVRIVDDNDPTESVTALLFQDSYYKILNGQSVIEKIYQDGKFNYVVVDTVDETSDSLNTFNNLFSMNQPDKHHIHNDVDYSISQSIPIYTEKQDTLSNESIGGNTSSFGSSLNDCSKYPEIGEMKKVDDSLSNYKTDSVDSNRNSIKTNGKN